MPDRSDRGAAPAGDRAAAAPEDRIPTTFAEELVRLASQDERICAITAGMPTGTGLSRFGARFPSRLFDVGIAEQHAVTMAAGLALGGKRPVVALYSTFSQRAYDQLVHDICQNDLPVLLAIDRAGLVGEDGTSHQGMFTLRRSAPCRTWSSARRRTSRSCATWWSPRSPIPGRSACTTRATPARTCRTVIGIALEIGRRRGAARWR